MKTTKAANRKRRRGLKHTAFVVLSSVMIFVTTYMMILPAITLELDTAEKTAGMDIAQSEEILPAETLPEVIEEENIADGGDIVTEETEAVIENIEETQATETAAAETDTEEIVESSEAAETAAEEVKNEETLAEETEAAESTGKPKPSKTQKKLQKPKKPPLTIAERWKLYTDTT